MFRKLSYWFTLIFSIIFLILAILSLTLFLPLSPPGSVYFSEPEPFSTILPFATLFVTAVGTFSSVFFGWRIDRRQTKESEFKIKELEIKIEQMRNASEVEKKQEDLEKQGQSSVKILINSDRH